jgi:hypothetical protein
MYDPSLGRFATVDPLSELMRRISPYAYAINNPMLFRDPDGMMPQKSGEEEESEIVGADGLTNSQWIESSRPGGDPELADAYKKENRAKETKNMRKKASVEVGNLIDLGIEGETETNADEGKIEKRNSGNQQGSSDSGEEQRASVPDYRLLYSSTQLDIFAETVIKELSTRTVVRQNIVYLQFDESGKKIVQTGGYQRTIVKTDASKTVDYSGLRISSGLSSFVRLIEESGRSKSIWDKYWDFVLSPQDKPSKNRLKATSSRRR